MADAQSGGAEGANGPAGTPQEGPVVVVTGGLSGIGRAVGEAFSTIASSLVLWDIAGEPTTPAPEEPVHPGARRWVDVVDVRDTTAVVTATERVVQRDGRVDVLVISAGITDHSLVSSGDPERWRAVIETNLLGTMHVARAVLPTMQAQPGGGHIFLIASVSGREAYVGEPAYIASKWGQVGLGHALRQEAAKYGVRVTLIEPGLVETPLTRNNPNVVPLLDSTIPLAPGDVAGAVVYAYSQPPNVVVSELTLRPLTQATPVFDL
jgi:NADP-dependent 3-hydroxy acid dehydrogenase YdfG